MNNSGNISTECDTIVRVVDPTLAWVCMLVVLFIIIFGTFGNVLSFLVLKYEWIKTPSNFYLCSLAIADTFTLVLGITGMAAAMIVRVIFPDNWFIREIIEQDPFCRIRLFLSFFTRTVSVFIIVLFTIERCVMVLRPTFSQSRWFSLRQAKINIAVLVVISFLNSIPFFFSFRQVMRPDGTFRCRVNNLFKGYVTYNLVLLSLIPSIIIICCNSAIVNVLRAQNKQADVVANKEEKHRQKQMNAITNRRLMVVSTFFVILSVPLLICKLVDKFMVVNCKATFANLQTVALVLYSLNFGINFALYCLTAYQFRLVVRAVLSCDQQRLANLPSYLAENVHPPIEMKERFENSASEPEKTIDSTTNDTAKC